MRIPSRGKARVRLRCVLDEIRFKHLGLLRLLFAMLARFRLYQAIALILALFCRARRLFLQFRTGFFGRRGLRVLAFDRPVFERDLLELSRRTDLDIFPLPAFVHTTLFLSFLPHRFKDQHRYHRLDTRNDQALKRRLQGVVERVFPTLRRLLRFDAVLTANVDYAQDQPWIDACERHGVPLLVLLKETISSDAHFQWIVAHYTELGFRFRGTLVLAPTRWMRKALLAAGVVDDGRVLVTGLPRNDSIADALRDGASRGAADRDWVVLFAFASQFPFTDDFAPRELWSEVLPAFLEAAAQHDVVTVRFIIKAKTPRDRKEIEASLARFPCRPNVELVERASLKEVIRRTRAAVGFNSTALVELMRTNVPLIVPLWGSAARNPQVLMFPNGTSSAALLFARSPDELVAGIRSAAMDPMGHISDHARFRAEREALIERFLFRIDEECSERVAGALRETAVGRAGA
ncbi:MAG: hypothetical protein ACE5JR_07205 [Gemmatimonadota bacterium]